MPSSADLTTAAGVIVTLSAVVGLLWREHMRQVHRTEVSEELWRDLALTGADLADKSTTIAVGDAPRRRAAPRRRIRKSPDG